MTTTDQRERILGHVASLMVAIRPGWDVAGCVAALRRLPDLPTSALVIAAVRYADDTANETPAHLSDLGNRAWVSDWHLPCKRHPLNRGWRPNGECGSCFADRHGVVDYEPRPRHDATADPHPLEAAFARSGVVL
jgi:hypothetical protein